MKFYLAWFNREQLTTEGPNGQVILAALLGGMYKRSPFMAELSKRTHSTLQDFVNKVDDFISTDDTAISNQSLRVWWEKRHAKMTKTGVNKSKSAKVGMIVSPCKGKDNNLPTKTTSSEEAEGNKKKSRSNRKIECHGQDISSSPTNKVSSIGQKITTPWQEW